MSGRFLILAMLLAPAAAQSQTQAVLPAEAGNLPPDFYTPSPCVKPDKRAVDTFVATDPQEAPVYNRKVAKFNQAAVAFNVCLKTYLDNSQHDVEQILSAVNTELAEARGTAPPPTPAAQGNMPAGFYPHSSCVKPDQGALGVQPSPKDYAAMTAYNLRVKAYNEQTLTLNTCLKTFVDNARRDIAQIEAAAHAAASVQPPSPEKP